MIKVHNMKATLTIIAALLISAPILANNAQEDQIKKMAEAAALKVAEGQEKADKKQTRAELENRPAVLKKTGGFIDVAAVGVSVVVVDTREKSHIAANSLEEFFED